MCETKNENSSNLLRGISENGGILFYGIDSTAIVRRMEQLHKTSAVTTAALGRLLTGVAMMGQMLKSDSDSVTVQIKGGMVFIDGELLPAEDGLEQVSLAGMADTPIRLGEDEYFLLGDNRDSSEDSRFANIGNVKRGQIQGKVWFRILPLLKLDLIHS